MELSSLSVQEINTRLKELKLKENEVTSEVVLHLSELEKRGAYRDLGYSSLFTYCTRFLGYSEGAACRRIAAAQSVSDPMEGPALGHL